MGLSIETFTRQLEALAPLDLAESWDPVGIALYPATPREVTRVLLAIDLTPAVLQEAMDTESDLVICYHPPIFKPLARLDARDPATLALLAAAEAGIALYAPHTALDAAPDGVADWIASAFAPATARPLGDRVRETGTGPGRHLAFETPWTLGDLMARATDHLDLPYLRVAGPARPDLPVNSLALCPGAGISVLRAAEADVFLTGEIRHHDALALANAGKVVMVSEHSHTERAYLPEYGRRIREATGVDVRISSQDRDPLHLVKSKEAKPC